MQLWQGMQGQDQPLPKSNGGGTSKGCSPRRGIEIGYG